MQINKLKKSLGFLYVTKTGFALPFFFVQEKQDSTETKLSFNVSKALASTFLNGSFLESLEVKYPVRITFLTTLQAFLELEILPVFFSFKEFVILKDVKAIKPAISGLNLFCNTEDFLKQDKDFVICESFQLLRT